MEKEAHLEGARLRKKLAGERLRSKELVQQTKKLAKATLQLRTSFQNRTDIQRRLLTSLSGTVTKREIRFSSSSRGKAHLSVEDALADVSRKLIGAQEQERARIARELHDDISQRLALLAIGIDHMHKDVSGPLAEVQNRVNELMKQTKEISTSIHDLAHEMHSSSLKYLGFVSAVKKLAKDLGQRQEMEIEIKNDGVSNALPAELSLCLYRIVQEALHNAAKHSGAKYVAVQLRQTADQIQITLRDSGKGFDVRAVGNGQGLGLTNMRERIRLVNGTIVIRSKPMGGTSIQACVPFRTIGLPPVANC